MVFFPFNDFIATCFSGKKIIDLLLRDRKRQSMSRGGAERKTQNLKQAPGSKLSAQSPAWGSNP